MARARVRAAQVLGPRVSVTGQPLPPVQPATATAQAAGLIDPAHTVVITRVLGALPHSLDPQVVAEAEHSLAAHATRLRPTELATGERLIAHLDPDGDLSDDTDRARRRALVIGAQGGDGMSPVHGLLDPTTRAMLDAALGQRPVASRCWCRALNPPPETSSGPTVNRRTGLRNAWPGKCTGHSAGCPRSTRRADTHRHSPARPISNAAGRTVAGVHRGRPGP